MQSRRWSRSPCFDRSQFPGRHRRRYACSLKWDGQTHVIMTAAGTIYDVQFKKASPR
ncbi:hypothetical protein Pla52o_04820 [Novipirellula galeiformis]|uniref:Uncharacterized protein n=1 Tax=Novipirellula galeiformis TaxID=2528004 RepID=A0A5C6CVA4_9BACT|nr:hypothetical protein Pla52o_04820 [Novipirellula galeiformis]